MVARVGVVAVGEAGDAAEDGAECAAKDIGGFAGGEVDGFEGEEREAERFEAEEQDDLVYVGWDGRGRMGACWKHLGVVFFLSSASRAGGFPPSLAAQAGRADTPAILG